MELSKQGYMDVIRVLQDIIDGSLCTAFYGLCCRLRSQGCSSRIVDHVAPTWPKFSGDKLYPVPCPDEEIAWIAFDKASCDGTLYTGDYGKLRLELAQFIVDYCEQKLETTHD